MGSLSMRGWIPEAARRPKPGGELPGCACNRWWLEAATVGGWRLQPWAPRHARAHSLRSRAVVYLGLDPCVCARRGGGGGGGGRRRGGGGNRLASYSLDL